MNTYKIEITQSERYIVTVKAKTEEEAKKKAITEWNTIADNGTHHYNQTGDTKTDITNVYDVTGTDDADN